MVDLTSDFYLPGPKKEKNFIRQPTTFQIPREKRLIINNPR
jgi:hypothetical protein